MKYKVQNRRYEKEGTERKETNKQFLRHQANGINCKMQTDSRLFVSSLLSIDRTGWSLSLREGSDHPDLKRQHPSEFSDCKIKRAGQIVQV